MRVLFRADSSATTGAGHVMRCLTLADALAARGATCLFLSRDNPGNALHAIRERGHDCVVLASALRPYDLYAVHWRSDADECAAVILNFAPDWVVVDHYGLSVEWHEAAAPRPIRRLVIDDLMETLLSADIVLNQNLGATPSRYFGLAPDDCTIFTGPAFALLRPEFADLRPYALDRRKQRQGAGTILLSLGATDPPNVTGWALEVLLASHALKDWHFKIVMGSGAPALSHVKKQVDRSHARADLVVDSVQMARLMAEADIAIGAGGATTWERCCLGLPTVIVPLAVNQQPSATALFSCNAALLVEQGDSDALNREVEMLAHSQQTYVEISRQSAEICDGTGVIKIVQAMDGVAST